MVNLIAELVQDWRRLDERIAAVSAEIESLAEQDEGCQRVMVVRHAVGDGVHPDSCTRLVCHCDARADRGEDSGGSG
jgi:hypothetical protein